MVRIEHRPFHRLRYRMLGKGGRNVVRADLELRFAQVEGLRP